MDSYTADAWRQAFQCVSSDWEEFVPEWAAESAIRSAYHVVEVSDGDEGVVAATIEAAASLWQSWEPDAFLALARAFMCAYSDLDMVKDQYIRENYPGTEASWFKDDAPVWDGLTSSDELMVEVNGAVYFFARPGTQRYATLSEVSRETE